MTAFQRLSTVPTIPELLRQDTELWIAQACHVLPPWRVRMAACFAGADVLLAAARLLNGCGLLSPGGIGACFAGAERLTRAGVGIWHASRRGRWLRERDRGGPPAPGGRYSGTRPPDHLTGAPRPYA